MQDKPKFYKTQEIDLDSPEGMLLFQTVKGLTEEVLSHLEVNKPVMLERITKEEFEKLLRIK